MIRPSCLLLIDIFLLQALKSVRIVTINYWPVCGACTEFLSTLLLICAQSGRVSGLEKKTDPASSARSDKKGLKDDSNRLLGILNKFCIPFGTKSKISICGGLDSDCTEVTLQQIANFRVKHLNSGIEQTQRGNILIPLLFIQPILILLHRFSVKNTVSRPIFSDILISPQITIFEISIFLETEKKRKISEFFCNCTSIIGRTG